MITHQEWAAFEEGFVRCAKHFENLAKQIRVAHEDELIYQKLKWKEELDGVKKLGKKK